MRVVGFSYWAGALSRAFRRQVALFVGAGLLIVAVLAGARALQIYLANVQIEQSSRGAERLASVLANQTDRSLRSVSAIVSGVVERLEETGANSVDALKAAARTEEIQSFLRDRMAEDPSLQNLFVTGADGRIDGHDSDDLTLADIHGRDHLRALRRASEDALYVSSPFKSKLTGAWQLTLSKRVSTNEGGFLGVVSGVIELASFAELLEKLNLGEHGSISVIRDDGQIIACFPQNELTLGNDIAHSDVFQRLISKQRDGVTRQVSDVDHVERMFAVVNSRSFPVVSVVGLGMNDVLANCFLLDVMIGIGSVAIALGIALGAIGLALHIESLAGARERGAVQAEFAIQSKRFNNAMDNIVQGLAMYNRSGALIACNKRYAQIYGLPVDFAASGTIRGQPVASHDPRFGTIVSEPRWEPEGSVLAVSQLPDGRFIAQRKKTLADGGWVSTHEDITLRRLAEDKIKEMATRDAVTGLSNRFDFKQRLEQCLAEARRGTAKFALHVLDLDHFKAVNDTFGHPVGDRLLQEVAERIKAVVRRSDTVARLGGDEFAVIQRISTAPHDALRLADRLIAAVSEPYTIEDNAIEIGTSIGISVTPDDSVDPDELLRVADLALYQSKPNRGSYTFYKASIDDEFRRRRAMDRELRTALAEERFELYFQPVVSVMDRQAASFEALLRWKHPERGIVLPNEFIPLAEENGLIVPLGEWALRSACREAAKWPSHIRVAVNVSALQFRAPAFLQSVSDAITAANISGSRLIVEVTESVMMKEAEQVISTLHVLRKMGVAIAMDDFGTGYSSLSYLRRFPFDKIKIDQSFIAELGQREDSTAIVRAAAGLARALGMQAVAEGVETENQLLQARIEGCHEAQGYLIRRPMPAREVMSFLGLEPAREPAEAEEPSPPPREDGTTGGNPRAPAVARIPLRRMDQPVIGRTTPRWAGRAREGMRPRAR